MRRLDGLMMSIAAGDALGATSEFLPRERVPMLFERDIIRAGGWPLAQVGGGWLDLPPGAHTDDTDTALCLYCSARGSGGFDPEDVRLRFIRWLCTAPRTVDEGVLSSVGRMAEGDSWERAGEAVFSQRPSLQTNGSLNRNAIAAALEEELELGWEYSLKQSLMTHYAPLPVLCCCAHGYMLHRLLAGGEIAPGWTEGFADLWSAWLEASGDEVVSRWRYRVGRHLGPAMARLRAADFDPLSFDPFRDRIEGRGDDCLLTLQIASWALLWSSSELSYRPPAGFPEEVFRRKGGWTLAWVALIGHDADTYCAVTAPLLFARHGELPSELLEGLHVSCWLTG